jgi:hypothetical protein
MDDMDTTKCISNPVWEAYAAHTLEAFELEYLHKHVLHCEICADMKAGIDAMADSRLLVTQVERIHRKVDVFMSTNSFGLNQGKATFDKEKDNLIGLNDAKANKSKQFSLFWNWSAAAAIILVAGFLMRQALKEFEGVSNFKSAQVLDNQGKDNQANEMNGSQVESDAGSVLTLTMPKKAQTPIESNLPPLDSQNAGPDKPNLGEQIPEKSSLEKDRQISLAEAKPQELVTENSNQKDVSNESAEMDDASQKETVLTEDASQVTLSKNLREVPEAKQASASKNAKRHTRILPSNASNQNPLSNGLEFNQNSDVLTINDSLIYFEALGQYNRGQLDSALQSVNKITPYTKLPYYKSSRLLLKQILEKRSK